MTHLLYSFSAATLGLPKLLREDDLQVEYPSDTDDEYVTEKGFQPTLPGEHTRLSSALALFRATRILARVLEKNYPSATTYDLSLQQMVNLESELDGWYEALPAHLKLRFAQDKPSTDVTGSRSPLLVRFHLCIYIYISANANRPLPIITSEHSSTGLPLAPALEAELPRRSCPLLSLASTLFRFRSSWRSGISLFHSASTRVTCCLLAH